MDPLHPIASCVCCGGTSFMSSEVLWPKLITEWQLAPDEIDYANRQQGLQCSSCGANLRSMALAKAIMLFYNVSTGTFAEFIGSEIARELYILELNEAGDLSQYLARHPRRYLACYPEVDMMNMPFGTESYDLIVHSDTLEHVPHPVTALAECHRVLRKGGACIFTIPMITGRLTMSRAGMPPSYHGNPETTSADWSVKTQYGADAWTQPIQAGFPECRIISLEYPAAQAFIGVKH